MLKIFQKKHTIKIKDSFKPLMDPSFEDNNCKCTTKHSHLEAGWDCKIEDVNEKSGNLTVTLPCGCKYLIAPENFGNIELVLKEGDRIEAKIYMQGKFEKGTVKCESFQKNDTFKIKTPFIPQISNCECTTKNLHLKEHFGWYWKIEDVFETGNLRVKRVKSSSPIYVSEVSKLELEDVNILPCSCEYIITPKNFANIELKDKKILLDEDKTKDLHNLSDFNYIRKVHKE
jgi:hypothetical protein